MTTLGTLSKSQNTKTESTTNFIKMEIENTRDIHIKLPNDIKEPRITGCKFMADGQLIVCDGNNKNIKLLNSKLDITDSLGLASEPWDISVIDNVTAVVTLLSSRQLQFIDIVPSLKAGKQIQLDKQCWGVDVVRDDIYVICHDNPGNAEIRVFDKKGTFIRKIPDVNNNLSLLIRPYYIAVNTNSSKIYVSDWDTGTVMCISVDGSLVFNHKHTDLRYPRTVIPDVDGNIIVCGQFTMNIHVVTSTGQHHSFPLYTVHRRRYNGCRSLAYRPADRTLVIGVWNDSMRVLKLLRNESTNFMKMEIQNTRDIPIGLRNDKRLTSITGCTFMADGQLLVCDKTNRNIKLLNSNFETTDRLSLACWPNDISAVDRVTAVITLPDLNQLQFIDILLSLKAGKQIKLDKRCWGVDVVRDDIYVICHDNPDNAEIRVFDKNGTFIRKIPDVNNNLSSLRCPYYIAVNTTSSKIYVSDWKTDTVRCVSVDGSLVFDYKHDDLRAPRTVIADVEGNIIVCGEDSCDIHVVTSTGQHHSVLYTVKGRRDNECYSVAYRPTDRTLVVGFWNDNNLLVLECAKDN